MSSQPGALRWLLLATHVPASGQGGGIVRYTTEMAVALHARDDVDLQVLCAGDSVPYFRELVPGAGVVPAPRLPRSAMAVFERWGVGAVSTGSTYDVVHGTKHLLPRGLRATSVLTVHDMILLDRPGDFDVLKRTLLRRPYVASLRGADLLASVSEASAVRVRDRLPETGDGIRVIPLATSTALRTVPPQPVDQLRGKGFALVVGDPSPRKNLPVVIEAWAEVSARVPAGVLAVVGPDSWGQTRYGPMFDDLQAQGRLLRLTNLDDARLRWCYENASVVLCPSLVEGFGLPAVEALDLGAPLITSLDPALCEVSRDRALHLPADRVDLWAAAIGEAMAQGRPAPVPAAAARTWSQVAAETVAAVRERRATHH